MSASTDHTDHETTAYITPETTNITPDTATSSAVTNTYDQIITFRSMIMTSQPAHTKIPDSTGLIAAAISAIIVLLGIVIVLVITVLLVKLRYGNVMKQYNRIS